MNINIKNVDMELLKLQSDVILRCVEDTKDTKEKELLNGVWELIQNMLDENDITLISNKKFKLYCSQTNSYFNGDLVFNSLEQIKKQLISFHKNDWEEDINILNNMKLSELLNFFEWRIHDEQGTEINIIDEDN